MNTAMLGLSGTILEKHTRPILISTVLVSFSSFNQMVEVWIHNTAYS